METDVDARCKYGFSLSLSESLSESAEKLLFIYTTSMDLDTLTVTWIEVLLNSQCLSVSA